jgi:cytochrome c5
MNVRVVFVAIISMTLIACGDSGRSSAPEVPEFSDRHLAEGRSVWMKTCRGCHLMGVAGAPAFNDPAAWAPRREKGLDMLYRSAINGKKKDGSWSMPPHGGNDLLSKDQVLKAVDFMLAAVDEASRR